MGESPDSQCGFEFLFSSSCGLSFPGSWDGAESARGDSKLRIWQAVNDQWTGITIGKGLKKQFKKTQRDK